MCRSKTEAARVHPAKEMTPSNVSFVPGLLCCSPDRSSAEPGWDNNLHLLIGMHRSRNKLLISELFLGAAVNCNPNEGFRCSVEDWQDKRKSQKDGGGGGISTAFTICSPNIIQQRERQWKYIPVALNLHYTQCCVIIHNAQSHKKPK